MERFLRAFQTTTFILLSMVFLVACQPQAEQPTQEISNDYPLAPTFHLNTPAGEAVSLPILGGSEQKVQMYLFWASWCIYCHELMPHLQSIKDEYRDQVDIYAINISRGDSAEEYINDNGYEFILLLDGDEVAELYEVEGTPGLVVIDPAGQMRFNLSRELAPTYKALSDLPNKQRSRRIAPWWSALIRKEIRDILGQA